MIIQKIIHFLTRIHDFTKDGLIESGLVFDYCYICGAKRWNGGAIYNGKKIYVDSVII